MNPLFNTMLAMPLFAQTAASERTRTEFAWTNLPGGLGLFLLIAVVAAVIYGVFHLYKREIDTCPPGVKMFLAALRAAVLITLAIIFLGPAMIALRTRTIHPTITILRDASQSMDVKDRYTDAEAARATSALLGRTPEELRSNPPARTAVVEAAFAKENGKLLRELTKKGRVRVVDFSAQSHAAASFPAAATEEPSSAAKDASDKTPASPVVTLPPLKAEGRSTDLAAAIREAVESDSPAAAIILTDGRHTGKDDPREAAREAHKRGVPLLVMGVGDPGRPRDLRVANVYVRPQVWSEEPFEIEAVVTAQGVDGGEANVELVEKRLGEGDAVSGEGTVVERKSLALPMGGGRLRVPFSRTVKDVGRFAYTVRVTPLEDEISEQDNQLDSQAVKVLSREKLRVLLVAGAPTWEFRMVEKLLQREKTMLVSCWLQTLDEGRAQEGSRPITQLPVSKEDLFWYDVVVMFDPNPQEFDRNWLELLKQFVGDHAGGLLYMAGPKYSGSFLTNTRTGDLRDVLPVRFGDVEAMEVSALLSTNSQAWPLKVSPAGVDHPIMTFFSDRSDTLKRWETLPGIYWSFPSLEPKPTSQVLIEHSDPTLRSVEGARPLMVAGRYGAGHVLYLGFNGTWRWRRAGEQAEYFDKFWIQAVRYLVEGRSLEGRRRGTVQTDRDRYELGEKVTFTARLQDASYQPLVAEKVEAALQAEGEPPLPIILLPVTNQPGRFESTWMPKKNGRFTLRLRVPGAGEDTTVEAPFQVELPSVETSQVWLDKPLLLDLASGSEGGYFEIDQLDALLAKVPDKTETFESRGRPEPLWDRTEVLWFLIGLLAVEWFVRKRNKLL